jgi:hypothetical protein
VLSDGDPALVECVRIATRDRVKHILDWFHVSMRVRHVEQALAGLISSDLEQKGPLRYVDLEVSRLRHLIWNGYGDEACRALQNITDIAANAIWLNAPRGKVRIERFIQLASELRTYLSLNAMALVDYGQGRVAYRQLGGGIRRQQPGQRAHEQATPNAAVAAGRPPRPPSASRCHGWAPVRRSDAYRCLTAPSLFHSQPLSRGSVASDLPECTVRHIPALSPETSAEWPGRWPRPRLLTHPDAIDTVALRPVLVSPGQPCGFSAVTVTCWRRPSMRAFRHQL